MERRWFDVNKNHAALTARRQTDFGVSPPRTPESNEFQWGPVRERSYGSRRMVIPRTLGWASILYDWRIALDASIGSRLINLNDGLSATYAHYCSRRFDTHGLRRLLHDLAGDYRKRSFL